VGATLTLASSKLRNQAQAGPTFLQEVPRRRSVSIATSTAQADSGVFEFSFRDERYMPFEGAGAVSSWKLSLPKSFRQFDYHTINDVIVHISYTAEENSDLRRIVEAQNNRTEGALLRYFSTQSSERALSLRQDFSSALNRLQHSAVDTPVRIQITDKYLPIFFRDRNIQIAEATLALKTAEGQSTNNFRIDINDVEVTHFAPEVRLGNLPSRSLGAAFATGLVGEHTLTIRNAGDLAPTSLQPGDTSAVDSTKLLDLIFFVGYRVRA
jgi:hypothetical protein